MLDFHPKAQTKPTPFTAHEDPKDARILSTEKWQQIVNHKARHRAKGNSFGYHLHVGSKPMRTITKEALLNNHNLIPWGKTARHLSTEELLHIGSFPHNFSLAGNYEDAFNRIGNSVPPMLMFHIASHIYQTFLNPLDTQEVHSMPLDFIDRDINPPGPYKFHVVSTFAGIGGSSLGYKWAGGKVVAAVEWDDNAVAGYRLNHQGTPVIHRDIAKVTVEELLVLTGLQPGELDILDGSPPCQGLSTAGKRQFDDPRNSLFKEYVRLLRGLQPKVFVMENVSGMVKGNMKHIFALIMRELKASGYQVKCQLMNAMYFGVPQSRERVIFIGVRNDLEIEPSHPMAETKPIGVGSAFENISHDIMAPPFRTFKLNVWRKQQIGSNGYISKSGKESGFNHAKIDHTKPCPTIPKSCVFGGFSGLYHWKEPRALSLGELKRAGSFPDAFQFIGGYEQGHNRIGNSVPPRFMESIATYIYTNILSAIPSHIEDNAHA
jgi:DNA (cytosine-5)-methyltransferase 1